jgi:hypothetical protein
MLKERGKYQATGYIGKQKSYVPGVDGPEGPEVPTNFPTVQERLGAKGSSKQKGITSGLGGNTLYD